jgi:hypothetical protein
MLTVSNKIERIKGTKNPHQFFMLLKNFNYLLFEIEDVIPENISSC